MSEDSSLSRADLAATAARGALLTLSGQGGRIALQLLSVIILARLLGPADFGLVAMASAFIGIGELLRDFGLSSAAIQSKELTKDQRDTLCWLNIALGAALSMLIFFTAPAIARLFGAVELAPIVQWLSLVVLFGGASTQYRASLTRELHFGRLVACELIAPTVGLSLGIIAALSGWGAYALVVQQVCNAAVGLISVAIAGRWFPGRPRLRSDLRPFITYGGNLFLSQVLVYASKNVDTVMLGTRFGATAVGIYDRAFQLMMTPITQLNAPFTRVALPVLSKLQDEPELFQRYLLRAQKLLMYFMVLILSFAASQAVPIVNIVLGSKWAESATILQILAVGGIFQMVGYSTMWIFLAKGLTKDWLLFTVAARSLMIGLIVCGSAGGVVGVAVGYSVGLAVQWPLGLWWVRQVRGVNARAMLRTGCKVIALVGSAAVPSLIISTWWRPSSDLWNLCFGIGALLILGVLYAVAIPAVRGDIREMQDLLRRARRNRVD